MPNEKVAGSGSGERKVAKQGLPTEVGTGPIFNAFLASTGDRELSHAATDLISRLAGDGVVERLASRLDAIDSAVEAVRVIATELGRAAEELGRASEASRAASAEAQAKKLQRVRDALLKMMESLYRLVESLRQDLGKHDRSGGVMLESHARAIESLRETVAHLRAEVKAHGVLIQEVRDQVEAHRKETREGFDRQRQEREADRLERQKEREADRLEREREREADRRALEQQREADRLALEQQREADRRVLEQQHESIMNRFEHEVRERKMVLVIVSLLFSVTLALAALFLQWAYSDRSPDPAPSQVIEPSPAETEVGPQPGMPQAETPSSERSGEGASDRD